MSIRIVATGSYVPERILTNQDLEKIVETNNEWIMDRTGIRERHIAEDGVATSDLAYGAACSAIEQAGIKPEEIDLIIVASITGDYIFPSVSCILQGKLGAMNAVCFDLQAACSGLLYSTEVASLMMRGSPRYKNALVLGAEKLSSIVDWKDRSTCVLFGDGAAAFILQKDENSSEPDTLVSSVMGATGTHTELLWIPAGGSKTPLTVEGLLNGDQYIKMLGPEVFKLAVNSMVKACKRVLEQAGVSGKDIRWLVPHQANLRILSAVASRLDVDAEKQVYVNVDRYGNTSAASIGLCLDEMNRNGLLNRGDLVLLTAFGGGLTWGAILLRW